MRVPCLCTEGDYECDMNYFRKEGGKCELLPDPLNTETYAHAQIEEDCSLDGFYYETKGYRKIPGNMCYGGVKLDPVKKACTRVAWLTSIVNLKNFALSVIVGACLYYGWPIIEAILIVLPIPDPKEQIQKARSYAGGFMGSNRAGGIELNRAQYSSNLEAHPGSLNDDDEDSDEDIGREANLLKSDDED